MKWVFDAGTDESFTITYTDAAGAAVDITGATFDAKVRESLTPGASELIDFGSDISITGDPALGVVTVSLPAARTSAWELTGLVGAFYQIHINLGGEVKPLLGPCEFQLNWRLSA